jgi:hypothetical protein
MSYIPIVICCLLMSKNYSKALKSLVLMFWKERVLKDQLGTDESLILLALQKLIKVGNQEINVQDKLLMESGSLYMESSFFADILV